MPSSARECQSRRRPTSASRPRGADVAAPRHMYGYCTSDVHYIALNECCLRYRVRTRFICILRYLHELNACLHPLILDAIVDARVDARTIDSSSRWASETRARCASEAPGLPPTMRRGRRTRGSSVRRGGWTARGAPTLLGRRRVAPATAMKKGTEDKDGGDYDATNGEVRFAELPRLREWAVRPNAAATRTTKT